MPTPSFPRRLLLFLVPVVPWTALAAVSLGLHALPPGAAGAGASWGVIGAHVGFWALGVALIALGAAAHYRIWIRSARVEAELARSRESYQRLVESTNVLPWEFDLASRHFSYVGPQAEWFIGRLVPSGEALEAWTRLIHPDDRDRVLSDWQASLARPRDHEREYRIQVDGKTKYVREMLHVETDGVRPRRLRGFVFDVTDDKRAEAERQRLEAQASHSKRMESLGVLAGGIAHDFNNLLVPLIGYADQALTASHEGRTAPRELARVLASAERARRLVRRILAFSADSDLERERVALVPFVDEALELLRASLPAHHELVRRFDAPGAMVDAEEVQLHQVILNLATNAAQAMNGVPGRIEVTVDTVDVDAQQAALHGGAPGRWARLRVADTGPGIPPEVLPRIFDPFFTTKHKSGGTGLGLSMVHTTVTAHGGWVSVDGGAGQGAAFEVFLPLAAQQAAPEERTSSFLDDAAGLEGEEHVLLVDDEAVILEMVTPMLETLGYRVTATPDPLEARRLLESAPERFDVLVTDETMPGLSGSELIIVATTVRVDLPVIVATGMGHLPVNPSLTRQPDLLVSKPYRTSALARAIRSVLDGRDRALSAVA